VPNQLEEWIVHMPTPHKGRCQRMIPPSLLQSSTNVSISTRTPFPQHNLDWMYSLPDLTGRLRDRHNISTIFSFGVFAAWFPAAGAWIAVSFLVPWIYGDAFDVI